MVYFGRRETRFIDPDNLDKNEFGIKKWSKEEYQRHFRNAASNLGMLPEARKWWFRQPLEYRWSRKGSGRKDMVKTGGKE